MKLIVALRGILLMTLASGCTCLYELRDEITDCKISISNHMMAKASYHEMDFACQDLPCPYSFMDGYIAGYISVLNGGNGCVPPAPQIRCCNHMWLDLSSECEKLEAWYDGYEHGAMVAKAEGLTGANQIVTRTSMPMAVEYATPVSDQVAPPTSAPEAEQAPPTPVPPAPKSEAEDAAPRQTRRIPMSIFE